MKTHNQQQLAFYLNGHRHAMGLEAIEGLELRPALLASYRNLAELRHDYPLVLMERPAADAPSLCSLASLCDALAADVPPGPDADRLRHLALRIEGEIRRETSLGATGSLGSLWERAERQLLEQEHAPRREDLDRLRAALTADGKLLDCNADSPWQMLEHCWRRDQEQRAERMRSQIEGLMLTLCDILKVDEENSDAGLGADRLRATFGSEFASDIDFKMMSHLLSTAKPRTSLSDARRQRLKRLLGVLKSQRFFLVSGAGRASAYNFAFDSCGEALKAYRQRLPQMVELAKAMMMAELEVEGTYREETHDALFQAIGATDLDLAVVAQFPDYLIRLHERQLTPAESAKLIELLSLGLPMKILLQTEEIAPPEMAADGTLAPPVSVRQWANTAIGIGGVFVLQATGSHLYPFRERMLRGLGYRGPALFCIYSGASDARGDLPPYLMAAAALESRAFPAFVYDPSAGPDWASRFYVGDTPQAERDWPVYELDYEDASLQRMSVQAAFTLVDFLALDARYAAHVARVPQALWNEQMVPVCEFIEAETQGLPEKVPYLLMVDAQNRLHRVLVSHQLIRQARRCREQWHTLRELGGIRNSFAEQLLARERQAWEAAKAQLESEAQQAQAEPKPAIAPSGAPQAAAAPIEAAPAQRSDEARIETIRCSSCNECTQINNRMFKYNENKQAYIADITAGTYAQLVQAAERCQLAIIHPGKPINPNEPGLEELLKRAEPFV